MNVCFQSDFLISGSYSIHEVGLYPIYRFYYYIITCESMSATRIQRRECGRYDFGIFNLQTSVQRLNSVVIVIGYRLYTK